MAHFKIHYAQLVKSTQKQHNTVYKHWKDFAQTLNIDPEVQHDSLPPSEDVWLSCKAVCYWIELESLAASAYQRFSCVSCFSHCWEDQQCPHSRHSLLQIPNLYIWLAASFLYPNSPICCQPSPHLFSILQIQIHSMAHHSGKTKASHSHSGCLMSGVCTETNKREWREGVVNGWAKWTNEIQECQKGALNK